jgi:thiol:disulfide interchange protein DsbA
VKFKQVSFSIFTLVTLFTYGVLTSAHAQEKPEVVFETSKGSFTLELYPDKAPNTVANFLKYVDDGFYDGTIFHRVIKDFVVQGGGFESGMKPRETRDNSDLDYKNKYMPGYTVFGKISKGMDVVEKISAVETTTVDRRGDVPVEEVKLISAKRVAGKTVAEKDKKKTKTGSVSFVEGEHYVVLDRPVPTRDSSKVEVVEMFSYGCPHCYEFETPVKAWGKQQSDDVDFWVLPAVWNKSMELYAGAFYAARELKVAEKIHQPLFAAVVIEQKSIRNESDLAEFFAKHGVDKKAFTEAFNSTAVKTKVKHAEERVRLYKPVGVPEIVVNGKYRIDRMRAGGLTEMLAVAEYLVSKERAGLKK